MNYLYLLLNLGSLSVPLAFTFHPKLKLYRKWKAIGTALVLSMLIFIPWDVIFTTNGFWGFNNAYYSGYRFFYLPIEEWLFFICIPYACIFTYYALLYYFPDLGLSKGYTETISITFVLVLLALGFIYYDRWYTVIVCAYGILLTVTTLLTNPKLLGNYYPVFLIILIPFFFVNGILTGSFIEDEVVWYNDHENMGIRLFTVPLEDTVYAFALILTNLLVIEYLKKRSFGNQGLQ